MGEVSIGINTSIFVLNARVLFSLPQFLPDLQLHPKLCHFLFLFQCMLDEDLQVIALVTVNNMDAFKQ